MISMPLVITDPLSPVVAHLGPVSIRWYGVAYAVAFLVGGWLAARHLARRGVPRQVTERITFWTIVAGPSWSDMPPVRGRLGDGDPPRVRVVAIV